MSRAINDETEGLVTQRGNQVANILDDTWDPDEADRFVKLAQGQLALLNYDEQRLWKSIQETPAFWAAKGRPDFTAIRDRWPALRAQFLEGKG